MSSGKIVSSWQSRVVMTGKSDASPVLVVREAKRQLCSDGNWRPWPQDDSGDCSLADPLLLPPWQPTSARDARQELREALRALERAHRLHPGKLQKDRLAKYRAITQSHKPCYDEFCKDSVYSALDCRCLRLFTDIVGRQTGCWDSKAEEESCSDWDDDEDGVDSDESDTPPDRRWTEPSAVDRWVPTVPSDGEGDDAPSTPTSPCTLPAPEASPSQPGVRWVLRLRMDHGAQEATLVQGGSRVAEDASEKSPRDSCRFCPYDGICRCCQRQAERENHLVWYRAGPTEEAARAKRARPYETEHDASNERLPEILGLPGCFLGRLWRSSTSSAVNTCGAQCLCPDS